MPIDLHNATEVGNLKATCVGDVTNNAEVCAVEVYGTGVGNYETMGTPLCSTARAIEIEYAAAEIVIVTVAGMLDGVGLQFLVVALLTS